MANKRLWKVFKAGLKSNNGDIKWKVGEWQEHKGELKMCMSGLHASERIIDAMQYTAAEQIARVEVKGKHLEQSDKQCWEKMRIVKVYDWTKEDSVSLAIFAAELVLPIFERKYPAEAAARAAWAAWAASWAAEAARAARAAWAARAASWAVEVARAAWAAAGAAAYNDVLNKCERFILKRLGEIKK